MTHDFLRFWLGSSAAGSQSTLEASRRLGALDLRMSGVQGGLGEHKRDILKLREEVNGLTVKSASHEALAPSTTVTTPTRSLNLWGFDCCNRTLLIRHTHRTHFGSACRVL
eukprot:166254-Amphidinium_carterae.1